MVFIPVAPIVFGVTPFLTTYHTAAGRYRFSISERETTVTELMAMARPAHSGFRVMPKKG
jgi:hypothetical protein